MTDPAALPPLRVDAEELVIAHLHGRLPAELAADVRAELYTGFEQHLPLVQVTRSGGALLDDDVLDAPRLDIDCHAGSRAAAADCARWVQAAMLGLKGRSWQNALVTKVIEDTGPTWRPDVNPYTWRFGLTYSLIIQPRRRARSATSPTTP